jgi:hypothetical protein
MDRVVNEYFDSGEDTSREATGTADRDGSWDQSAFDRKEARFELRQKRQADRERQQRRGEFVDRYTTGEPSEGITTEEALEHLQELRDELSPAEFRDAMQKTLDHLPADQRDEVNALIRHMQGAHGAEAGAAATGAGATAEAGAMRPAPLAGLLGGLVGDSSASGAGARGFDIGDILNDLRSGGLNAPATGSGGKATEADFAALMNSPLARAVLGGVAAYAMQTAAKPGDDETISRPSNT